MKQGSILSPVLFLLVMDPLLRCLETSKVDIFCAGGFVHADIRSLFQCEFPKINAQVEIVKGFARDKFLEVECVEV